MGSVVETNLFQKMNYYNLQQKALAALAEKGPVICPKPTRPLRWQLSQHGEGSDSKAGAELLDIIFKKESYGEEQHGNQEASSPPYFLGSPPVRAANPLIQDAQFGYQKHTPPSTSAISSLLGLSPSSSASGLSSPSSALRKGGCVRVKLGIIPAAVRKEGFDCHVPAVA